MTPMQTVQADLGLVKWLQERGETLFEDDVVKARQGVEIMAERDQVNTDIATLKARVDELEIQKLILDIRLENGV